MKRYEGGRIRLAALLALSAWAMSPLRADDGDDLSRIKRTNGQFPDRPAAQQAIVTAVGTNCKVLFLGDSNTQGWENGDAKHIWDYYYKARGAINFGIGGDAINDIRARLRDTQWGNCRPAVSVVLAGTNDRGGTPEHRAANVKRLVDEILTHFPDTKVLLVSIPPCGLDEREALTVSYFATDDILKTYADDKRVFYIDLAKTMTWEEGLGFTGLGGDRLHLDDVGRMNWAELMEPIIAETLHEAPRPPLPHPQLPPYTGEPNAPKLLFAGDGICSMLDFRAAVQSQLRDRGLALHVVGPYTDRRAPANVQPLHFAMWGTSLDTLRRTVPAIAQKYAPDVLLLFAGLGEVNYGKNQTDIIAPQVDAIIDAIAARTPDTRIVLALITPHASAAKNATIVAANARLLGMLKARAAAGKPIPFVDVYSAVATNMLTQGYLPRPEALRRAAALASPTLEALLRHRLASSGLSAPAGLTLTREQAGNALTWKAVAGATGYHVKRSLTAGGPYAVIAADLPQTGFRDSITRPDTAYYYVVAAVNAEGQGDDCAEVALPAGGTDGRTPR